MMNPITAAGAAPAPSEPGLDPYAQFAAATKAIAEMQQNYHKVESLVWHGWRRNRDCPG
jgi:hypothetical protein